MQQVTEEQIIEVLKKIEDPELFLDIWFLGLIYSIDIDEQSVKVTMTFTSPMCPAGPELKHKVVEGIKALDGVSDCLVEITFVPAWQPSDEVKGMLGML